MTASQVNFLVSTAIIVIFTAALFFSGFVIQQRTLRDLRKAIKPEAPPSPKIYLPDRFKKTTTELDDGRIIEIDDNNDDARNGRQQKHENVVIEVRPSVPQADEQKPLVRSANQKASKQWEKMGSEQPGEAKQEKKDDDEEPISRAERRRRIKQEILELSQGEAPVYYQRRLW